MLRLCEASVFSLSGASDLQSDLHNSLLAMRELGFGRV
jgi:hypothetical protein